MDGLNFYDLIKALYEINLLEDNMRRTASGSMEVEADGDLPQVLTGMAGMTSNAGLPLDLGTDHASRTFLPSFLSFFLSLSISHTHVC